MMLAPVEVLVAWWGTVAWNVVHPEEVIVLVTVIAAAEMLSLMVMMTTILVGLLHTAAADRAC